MKTRFVSISPCKSNSRGMIGMSRVLSCSILTLIPVFSCQSRMCFRCICVFTSSNFLCMDVATWSVWLWNYAELWKWYLTLWDANQSEGSITKISVFFFKKNSGHYGSSLYEGVFGPFGPSLTSLFDVSKPLPLLIDIYTLHQYCGMIRVNFYISVVWITTSWVLLAFGGVILVILIQGAWWHERCRQGAKCCKVKQFHFPLCVSKLSFFHWLLSKHVVMPHSRTWKPQSSVYRNWGTFLWYKDSWLYLDFCLTASINLRLQ